MRLINYSYRRGKTPGLEVISPEATASLAVHGSVIIYDVSKKEQRKRKKKKR